MSDTAQLEAHLRAHPGDWPGWLVYADLLLEQGDVRGTLIGLEHRIEMCTISDEERDSLHVQIDTLTRAHRDEWLDSVPVLKGTEYTWRFGFVMGVTMPWKATTLETLAVLRAHPTARFFVMLSLYPNHMGGEGTKALASSDSLRSLTTLDLYDNNIGDEGARALASSESLHALTTLELRYNHIGADGARALATSDTLRRLTTLHLFSNDIGDEGARALATSDALRTLTTLDLVGNNIGDEGARIGELRDAAPMQCVLWVAVAVSPRQAVASQATGPRGLWREEKSTERPSSDNKRPVDAFSPQPSPGRPDRATISPRARTQRPTAPRSSRRTGS